MSAKTDEIVSVPETPMGWDVASITITPNSPGYTPAQMRQPSSSAFIDNSRKDVPSITITSESPGFTPAQMLEQPTAALTGKLGQGGGQTAFDKIIAKYQLTDPAVLLLAEMVRAADRKLPEPAEGAGVAAMSHGFAEMGLADEEVLTLQLPMWEALYHFCRSKVGTQ